MDQELMEKIVADISEREPDLAKDSHEFKAEVICLILYCAELPESTEELGLGIVSETGYSVDFVGSILASLETGDVLSGTKLNENLVSDLAGENSGKFKCRQVDKRRGPREGTGGIHRRL